LKPAPKGIIPRNKILSGTQNRPKKVREREGSQRENALRPGDFETNAKFLAIPENLRYNRALASRKNL